MNDLTQRQQIVWDRALDVFEVQTAADVWLRTPSVPLGGIAPMDLADTDEGVSRILAELSAIEYGIPL